MQRGAAAFDAAEQQAAHSHPVDPGRRPLAAQNLGTTLDRLDGPCIAAGWNEGDWYSWPVGNFLRVHVVDVMLLVSYSFSYNYEVKKSVLFYLVLSHTDFAAGSTAGKLRHGIFRAAYQFLGGPRQIGC